MARITPEIADEIALLARLKITDAERDALAGQLERILDYVGKLEELDTTGVEPTAQLAEAGTPLRPDEPAPSLGQEKALANAPEAADGFFVVPRILESSE